MILCAIFFVCVGIFFVWASTIKLPDLSNFEARKVANSSKITDRTGKIVLYDISQSVHRSELPLNQMGTNIQNAVIDIEDVHFYQHAGIRPTSILRAMLVGVKNGGTFTQGGSTITQQIIKNTLLNTDKSFSRKFKEWILALKLERYLTKDQILTIYLNDAPLGGTIYGVQEAAQSYFGVDAKDLSIPQAAYIAAMLPAPTYYSPYGTHKAALDARQKLVLEKMKSAGYLSQTDYDWALKLPVTFSPQTYNSIKAPHFVFYILNYLEQKYGADVMENGGYTIKTTLDYDMQQKAEQIIGTNALTNEKKYGASNSALVAIDPKTGQILSMVGSRNYFDKQIDGAYNVALAHRQPGSSFKPFVYAKAFSEGYLPDTVLFDLPTEFSTNCDANEQPLPGHTKDDCYHPSDFDNKFKGPISIRSALAESRNVPAVKALYLVGLDDAISTAKSLGISTLKDKSNYGLSLVLGGGEVTPLDMASAYSVFANEGVRNPATGILEIDDQAGNVVEQYQQNSTQVLDKNVADMMNDVLSDASARAPTFGSAITIPGVAVKTGTTNDDRDAWTIGYTPDIAVSIWSGNNDNSVMRNGGSAISGPSWVQFMQAILPTLPNDQFTKPIPDPDFNTLKPILRGDWSGNQTVSIDKTTGLLATGTTPVESVVQKTITDVQDILHWVQKNDPRGPVPTNPDSDPEYHLWNPPVLAWWAANSYKYPTVSAGELPTTGDQTTDHPNPILSISGLPTTFSVSDTPEISISDSNPLSSLQSAEVYIDSTYITTLSSPFKLTLSPEAYGLKTGSHALTINGTNTVYGKSTVSQSFSLTQ